MDRDLETVVVFVYQPADFDDVILLDATDSFGNVVPHLGVDLSCAVGQRKSEKVVATLLWLYLLAGDDEGRGDDLVFVG